MENVSSEEKNSLKEERERLSKEIDEAENENESLFPYAEIKQFKIDLEEAQKRQTLKIAKEVQISKIPSITADLNDEDQKQLKEERKILVKQVEKAEDEKLFPKEEIKKFIAKLIRAGFKK